ncbi:hypothetical protein CASFOL_017426 [Castilleja foliolosa]|uniref:Uncharacterized protein n=1 Tax=Castilleja foliolosa TaxID=1961234 RepID=A0ABD3DEK6_9LAMI
MSPKFQIRFSFTAPEKSIELTAPHRKKLVHSTISVSWYSQSIMVYLEFNHRRQTSIAGSFSVESDSTKLSQKVSCGILYSVDQVKLCELGFVLPRSISEIWVIDFALKSPSSNGGVSFKAEIRDPPVDAVSDSQINSFHLSRLGINGVHSTPKAENRSHLFGLESGVEQLDLISNKFDNVVG